MRRTAEFRRHKSAKAKEKARRLLKNKWGELYPSDKRVGKSAVNHLCECSCAMCGNPRKFVGEKSLAERKEDLRLKED